MNEFLQVTGGTVTGSAILLLAVRWLIKDREGIVRALQASNEARIASLETRTKACEEDRKLLREKLDSLQEEFRTHLLRSR